MSTKTWHQISTYKHKKYLEENIDTGPAPSFMCFVVVGSLIPFLIKCGQTAQTYKQFIYFDAYGQRVDDLFSDLTSLF